MSGGSGLDDMQQQLVSSVVGSLLQIILGPGASRLFDSLLKESQVLAEFRPLFSEIKSHLEVLQAFMVDASSLKRKEPHLRRELARLMELIYDTENILTDCQTRLTNRWIHSPRQLLFRYQFAKRLKQIKMEIEGIEKNLKPFKLRKAGEETNQTGNARPTTHHVKESEIVGLERDTEKIKDWILYQNRLSRVAIVGMGGLGKSTIAQMIFNNTEVQSYFDVRVWMSVSAQVIEKELLKNILDKINKGDRTKHQGGDDCDGLLTSIKLSLLNKKFLIVMDDVWSIDGGWWGRLSDALREDDGSSIIVTTRDERVAKRMSVVEDRIHRPKCLDDEESWFLFSKFAFLETRVGRRNPQLEDVGKTIVKKCKGLPLAIKAMAGILRLKPSFHRHWQQVADNFESEILREIDKESSEVKASLRLSYDALPLRLKQCVLCFSIFPEDFMIDVEQLVYWWVGEGFAYAENGRTALESAYDSLSELVSRCLVEVADQGNYDGRIYTCKMHDIVRDTIIKIAEEDRFCNLDEEENHHLGLANNGQVGGLKNYSNLWAFLVTNKFGSSAVKLNLPSLGKSKSLRVLDLSSSNIDNKDQLRWICSLRYLTCLSFKGVVGIEELPDQIKKLQNLQILVLNGCITLKKLPDSLMTLKNLTVLDVRNCTFLRHLPRGLGKLSNLQVLSGFCPASSTTVDSSQLTDLEKLTQLRILRLCITEEDQIVSVNVDLSRLNRLQLLDISIGDSRGDENLSGKLDLLVPSNCLREVYLRNFKRETRPTWLNPVRLPRLEYLSIENGDLKELISINTMEKWTVEGLCLKMLPALELEWKTLKHAMTELKYVEVSGCPMLKDFEVPHHSVGIWRVPEEEEVDLENVCLEDEIEKLKRLTLHKQGLSAIAILGMDEGGETDIAHKFFYDTEVELDFGVRIRVSFSSERELLKKLLDEIKVRQRREYQGGTPYDNLLHHINESLSNKKFLLVLNNVQGGKCDEWWDRFFDALPKGNGSCVIVTTRSVTRSVVVAKMKGVKDLIYRPSEENWLLFCKIAFEEDGGRCRDLQLAEVAKEIVVNCRGVRKAIELMAGIVRHTPPQKRRSVADSFIGQRKLIKETLELKTAGHTSPRVVILNESVSDSYHILPRNLKQFMSLFFLLTESMTVEVEQLVYWWVGGGFASAESGKTTLVSAYASLSELVSRRLVDVVDKRNYDGRIYTCTVNLDVLKKSHGVIDNILKKIRHYFFVPKHELCSGLTESLRVVDLSFLREIESQNELTKMFAKICYREDLRCFIMKGMKGIKELPDQFKRLLNLQLLILTDCTGLQTLPAGMMTLRNLIVLDIKNCTSLRYLPKGLGTLSNLQVLSGFRPAISTSMDGSLLKDLENLTQLRILRLCVSEKNQIDGFKVDLSSLEHLKLLEITIDNRSDKGKLSGKLDQLSPPACLRELYLRGFRRKTGPTWLKPARLPHLEYLCIENGSLKVLSINTTEKWNLEGLYLKNLPRLELEWRMLRSIMPCLKYVEVSGCYMLKGFEMPHVRLDGIWRLPKKEEEEEEEEEE